MVTDIFLVRHGQTEWNKLKIIQGWQDIDLNYDGRKEAKLVADILKKHQIASIYSSSLKRALNTAKIIARPHQLPVVLTEEFREIKLGIFEGKIMD